MAYTLKQAARDVMAPERPSMEQIRAVLVRVLGREAIRKHGVLPASWAPSVAEDIITELREGDMVPDADLFEAKCQRDEAREQRNRAQRQVADLRQQVSELEGSLKAADEDRDMLRRRMSDDSEPEEGGDGDKMDEPAWGEHVTLDHPGDKASMTHRVTFNPDGSIEVERVG